VDGVASAEGSVTADAVVPGAGLAEASGC
jgi:hypothetical protein